MKVNFFIVIVSILSMLISCDKKRDKVFSESPTVRLNSSVNNSYEILQGNQAGWMIAYFPSNDLEFGGYTMFARFINNVEVVVEGDFTTKEAQTSTYIVSPGAGPILTFDTFNSIFHYFSLPGYFNRNASYQLPNFFSVGIGSTNEGMKGEYDFLLSKVSVDSIILNGRKSYNNLVMTPILSSESATIVGSYREAVAKFHPFAGYNFEVGTETIQASFINSLSKRALRVAGANDIYAYRYTPEGLSFYKEYDLKGVKFKELKYIDPVGAYTKGYFTNDAGTLKLVPTT